jgi:hypothetical protein
VARVNAANGAARSEEDQMKFMVSLITDGTAMENTTPEQMKEFGARMGEYMAELGDSGALVDPGAPLGPSASARTLRRKSGKVVVTDGPFAETKEQIAGYMVLECKDIDEATNWAERMPVLGGAIEVRPIAERPSGP